MAEANKLERRERSLLQLIADRASGLGEKQAACNALVAAQTELTSIDAPRPAWFEERRLPPPPKPPSTPNPNPIWKHEGITIRSKFESRCAVCGDAYHVGDRITLLIHLPTEQKKWVHAGCAHG